MPPHLISNHIHQRFTTLSIFNINKILHGRFVRKRRRERKRAIRRRERVKNIVIPRLSTSGSVNILIKLISLKGKCSLKKNNSRALIIGHNPLKPILILPAIISRCSFVHNKQATMPAVYLKAIFICTKVFPVRFIFN